MNEFQQEIYKTIDILTEQKLKQLGFDRTKRGKVISLSVDHRNCMVEIDGSEYNCKLRRGIYVEPNDIVFVKFPQNSGVDKYVDTVLGGNETPENLIITAEEILAKLKEVDGHDSGLDADMLDGKHGSEYALKTELQTPTFIHSQIAPLNEWNVLHNLNRYPAVTVVDSGGTVVFGDIQYVSENQVKIIFTSEFSGKAYLS